MAQILHSLYKTLKNIMHHWLVMVMVTCKILIATMLPIKETLYRHWRNQDIGLVCRWYWAVKIHWYYTYCKKTNVFDCEFSSGWSSAWCTRCFNFVPQLLRNWLPTVRPISRWIRPKSETPLQSLQLSLRYELACHLGSHNISEPRVII